MHHAGLRQVVERCVVRGKPIVPEGHVAELPAPTDRELGLGEMREEEGEQRVAFFLGQFENARGETGIDEEPSPAVLDCANDRMDDGRIGRDRLLPFLLSRADAPAAAREASLETVLGRQSVEELADGRGQRFVGCDVRAPQGVAAARRQDARRENGAEWRGLDEGDVGVPIVVVRQIVRARLD